ncbi:hypothetical protein FVB32_08785 [Flagellimonas hymeniacidonis]|uniref:Uncharacterized protein n=1 Tax=Flagellimonas hymeniacidonis TaxID=2603628 RepID=A0A5C8V8D0_9FLAO|nr:hypothetical protein [Flagellimonas hymeniacidonis]TXN38374.1 hypothetical protein FVB32_08785 [Flagellimonas hymeniacidonis]
MKYRNYIVATVLFAFAATFVNAKSVNRLEEEFDINKVIFIEDDQDWELGFDTAKYLPENFDPYSGAFSLKAINYIDDCDEIDLGFETAGYLPAGFDPYIQ